MKRVMLVDEHDVARRGLRDLLTKRPRLEVVAEAGTGHEALDRARECSPDIAILAYSMPDFNGSDLTAKLRTMLPAIEVLIYTVENYENVILDVMDAGARGFVLKSDPEDYVLSAIDALCLHRAYVSKSVSEILLKAKEPNNRRTTPNGVTSREREVVQLIAEGKINKQIAFQLNVSIKTVESHRASAMEKLNLRNIAEVVRYACRNNIVAA